MKKRRMSTKKLLDKMKRREWAKARYGDDPTRKSKMLESNAEKLRLNMTSPERKMESVLKKLNLIHESQKVVGGFIYDFHLPEYKILIEVDGDYYHGHPDKYDTKDLNLLQRKIKRNDLKKDSVAMGLKYTLLRFWECDINDDIDTIINEIKKHTNEPEN